MALYYGVRFVSILPMWTARQSACKRGICMNKQHSTNKIENICKELVCLFVECILSSTTCLRIHSCLGRRRRKLVGNFQLCKALVLHLAVISALWASLLIYRYIFSNWFYICLSYLCLQTFFYFLKYKSVFIQISHLLTDWWSIHRHSIETNPTAQTQPVVHWFGKAPQVKLAISTSIAQATNTLREH